MVKYIKCSEIIDVRDGTHDSPKYINEGGYPLVTSKNIKDNMIDFENANYISIEDYTKINQRSEVANGDIIMPMIGTIGNPVLVNTDKMFAIKNVALFKLANNEKVDSKFFYYVLKSENIVSQLNKQKRGGTQNFVSLSNIRDLKIPVIDIKKQRDIVGVLDVAQELINKRKEQIESLDELVKSKFIEMFGYPSKNDKGWTEKTFGNISTVRQGLQIPISKRKTEPSENCFKYITIQFLNGGKSAEYIENPKQNVICNTEDVLMTRTGNTGMVVSNVSGVFHNNFFLIDFDRGLLNKVFLVNYLNDDYIQADIIRRAGTSTIPDLNHGEFYKVKILLPPMELQIKFAYFVKQFDKLKFEMETSLKELENNFNSLMQRAFKGELFN